MSPSLKPTPEPSGSAPAVAGYSSTSATQGGASNPPPSGPGAFEAQLKNDSRVKANLHALILVLPLAILIFGEALQHPKADIELPIIKLKLQVASVLPIFVMIISYMLHRAMRYTRIVLWTIGNSPEILTKVVKIALDDTETYKVNSIYYEDMLDPMAAELFAPLTNDKRRWLQLYGVLLEASTLL
jgi:hypothetical protein